MKRKIVIAISLALLLACAIAFCATRPQRVLKSAYKAIPEGIQFYDENRAFFDLLLDIKDRIIAFNSESEEAIRDLHFNIYFGDEFWITGPGGGHIYPGSQFDLLTIDERRLIDTTLRKRERPGERFIDASVSGGHVIYPGGSLTLEGHVRVSGFFGEHSDDAWVSLISPVNAADRIAISERWRSYVEPLNNDWSIVIGIRYER